MKRFLGWLVNLYPNHVFYSDQFMPEILAKESSEVHASKGNTALLGTAIAAARVMQPGDVLTSDFTSVTNKGRDVGDYKITIERLR